MSDRWDPLLATLRARFAPDATPDELAAFLAGEGLDGRQIGEVVRRFRDEPETPPASPERSRARRRDAPRATNRPSLRAAPAPVRVAGPHERGRFTPDAWGRLLQLAARGILAAPDLERVIDHALDHGGGRVDLPALRAVLDGVGLADAGADSDPTTIH